MINGPKHPAYFTPADKERIHRTQQQIESQEQISDCGFSFCIEEAGSVSRELRVASGKTLVLRLPQGAPSAVGIAGMQATEALDLICKLTGVTVMFGCKGGAT